MQAGGAEQQLNLPRQVFYHLLRVPEHVSGPQRLDRHLIRARKLSKTLKNTRKHSKILEKNMKTPRKPCETLWRRLLAVAADAQAHGARDAGAQDPPRGLVLLREALRVQAVEAPPVRRAASRGL